MRKTCPNWKYVLAVALWAAMCAALYVVNYRLYDGMLLMDGMNFFWLLLLLPPLAVLSVAARAGEPAKPVSKNSIAHRLYELLGAVLVAACAVCILWMIRTEPYRLTTWLAAAVLGVCGTLFVLTPLRRFGNHPLAAAGLFACVLLTLGAYLLTVHPMTNRQAARLVADAGYQNADRFRSDVSLYVGLAQTADGAWMQIDITGEYDPLGYYLFRADKDGERFCVAVSVLDGRIEEEQRQSAAKE